MRAAQSATEGSVEADRAAGITPEDRADILAAIEVATRSARISGEPALAAFKARRRGLLLPVAANLTAIVVAAGGILGLSAFFAARDAEISQGSVIVSTAEGKLIQEIKRESESRLQEKDQAIADIQDRLATLDKERGALSAGIEERIKKRELELRAALDEELERERARLRAEGLSEAVVQERIRKFEEERNAVFRREIEALQSKAAEEQAAADANFKRLRDEYQSNLAGLADERRRIQEDSRKREEELRASLDAKTKSLEEESRSARAGAAAATAGLEAAKLELAKAEDLRQKARQAEDRVTGLYSATKRAFAERRYEEAAAQALALRAYLDEPSVASSTYLAGRREADLFAAEAFGLLARAELQKSGNDAKELLAQAGILAAIREDSRRAGAALSAGDAAQAEAGYRAALARLPEIRSAHEWLLARLESVETARRSAVEASFLAADLAWKAGRTEEALGAYAEALAWLPVPEASRRELETRLSQAAVARARAASRESDSRAARPEMERAAREAAAGRQLPALTAYIGVLAAWPAAEQAADAKKGADAAMANLLAASEAATLERQQRFEELRDQLDKAKTRYETDTASLRELVRKANVDGKTALDELRLRKDEQIARLEKSLEASQAEAEAANAELTRVLAELTAARAELQALKSSARPGTPAAQGSPGLAPAALEAWKAFQAKDTAASDSVRARSALFDFLRDPAIAAAFPGLSEKVGQLERDARGSTADEAYGVLEEMIASAGKRPTPEDRASFLEERARRTEEGDPALAGIVRSIAGLLTP